MLRLVMDTDVRVAAFDSPTGASLQMLLTVLEPRASLLMSSALFLEYEAVLIRPTVLEMIGADTQSVLAVLDELAILCVAVSRNYQWRPVAADPGDDMVVETAINGVADAIVTFNLKHMRAGAERFGIDVIQPAMALRRLQA
jgi:putative PIN family toxin of toxin-antitoxin system